MEFELCKLLHCTPRDIGQMREQSPTQIAFLEMSIINERKSIAEANKKQSKSKSKGTMQTKKGLIGGNK